MPAPPQAGKKKNPGFKYTALDSRAFLLSLFARNALHSDAGRRDNVAGKRE